MNPRRRSAAAFTATKETPNVTPLRRLIAPLAALALALGALGSSPVAAQAASPGWDITSLATPGHLAPGDDSGFASYYVKVTNIGGAATSGAITITDALPAGVSIHPGLAPTNYGFDLHDDAGAFHHPPGYSCTPGPPATCTVSGAYSVKPGETLIVTIPVDVGAAAASPAVNQATVSGGGAATASTTEQTPVTLTPAGPGFERRGFSLTDADGAPLSQAGAHPSRLRVDLQLNMARNTTASQGNIPIGTIKDVRARLAPGLVVNPQATPVLCTEVQLESNGCPDASAVGIVHPTIDAVGLPESADPSDIFNMVPPPGAAADLGFNVPDGNGLIVHLLGGVDAAGDYALTSDTRDISQFGNVTGFTADFWGNPSDPSHDTRRGDCVNSLPWSNHETCPVPATDTPLLTMPSACSGSLAATFSIDFWEDPGSFLSTDAATAGVSSCDQLQFDPTLTARPTTNVADSPSGLDVALHIPQTDSFDSLATSTLKKTVVTLPEGLTVNPSASNGLEACSSSQIGLTTPIGQTPIHFSADSPNCPDAAKLGTVEVTTPLLDAPLQGAVYLAKPHDNPFGSMLALYIVVDDPQTGVVLKLPGEVQADPSTGRLTTSFDDNPQLPFSDFKLSFFGGSRGALRTPSSCGPYQTNSEMTPWSGTAPVDYQDNYSIDQAPSGGSCGAPASQPNSPSFDAGTVSPLAGTYSTFVLNLDRPDGSQQFSQITLNPPPGFTAKLAGTAQCTEAQIAGAQGRTASGDGALEQNDPSCPADSQIGTVNVAAGAGPAPFWAKGKVYLAGPYKGSPLSVVVITPAVAGPFDLGVVVTRAAASIDPSTAQITTTADAIPDHLTVDGNRFLLDVRSVRLHLDKPEFSLNGTSCDPSSITGSLLSTEGQTASLSEPFQLAECVNLPFKPKIGLRLRGGHFRNGHPALTTVLSARNGDANVGRAQVLLPPTMQLDQSHIQAPCTRPQFAADQCPSASVIGSVVATSPLLDYKLTGPVYLRTGNNPLPDIVLDLHGPASQPIRITQVGKIDTVHARLRSTFATVPDAPISRAIIRLVGGHKGLLVNNTNLCKQTNRAAVFLNGHNNKIADSNPQIALRCPKVRKHHRKHRRHHRRHHARHHLRNNRAVG